MMNKFKSVVVYFALALSTLLFMDNKVLFSQLKKRFDFYTICFTHVSSSILNFFIFVNTLILDGSFSYSAAPRHLKLCLHNSRLVLNEPLCRILLESAILVR